MIQSKVIYQLLLDALKKGETCALATIAKVTGSTPRDVGAKMLIYQDRRSAGTIGGGKFESLVVAEAMRAISDSKSILKTYPLHEASENSFGAICGGEVTILIEPMLVREALFVVGAGHCAQAIVRLAIECGLFVQVIEDRAELLGALPPEAERISNESAAEWSFPGRLCRR